MSKYRWLIERSTDELLPWHLTTVNRDGEAQGVGSGEFATVDEAKARAQELMTHERDDEGEPISLVWKDPPEAWQPDAVAVSQHLTPMYPDLPT